MRSFLLPALLAGLLPMATYAQIDPSAALIIQGSRTSTREGGLDSGRYKVMPKTTEPGSATTVRRVERPRAQVPMDEARPVAQEAGTAVVSEEPSQPALVTHPQSGTFLSGAGVPPPEPPPLRQVLMGGTGDELDQYRQTLSPMDRRLNLLEVSLAPTFIYNDSQSSYAFRDYVTSGPGFEGEARVWFSPFFGVQGSYAASLSGDVNDSLLGSGSVPATHQWIRGGIRSRRFLSSGRSSPAMSFGVDYYEYQMRVPLSAQSRGRIRTTGAQLSLEGDWPTSARYSWVLGVSFLPKARHKESATGLDLRSGANADTNGVGFSVGGRLQYDRSGSMFYRLSHTVEKNLFSGGAAVADPVAGNVPNGVPVLNSFTIFQLGYTWGN
ncbi:MAG: hypothetical protein NDI61_11000 [Bdellovibrionaceae bacterium]|nr:hypothetical protein [Pseudobdellovibrionaceae bacterium]